MIRTTFICLVMFVAGGAMIFMGVKEVRARQKAPSHPVDVDIASIENSRKSPANYLTIRRHAAIYPLAIYSWTKSSSDSTEEPSATTPIESCYYPIVSEHHPFVNEINELIREHGGLEKIPQDVAIPKLTNAAMLVKTIRFRTLGDIPQSVEIEENLTGLIINELDSLDADEVKLLREGLPDLDQNRILVLQQDRKPGSFMKCFMLLGGGAVFILGAFVVLWSVRKGID